MTGTLDVLACGHGHLELSFNSQDPLEVDRARRAVTMLMRQGCILFAEVDGQLQRVLSFNPETDKYVIADVSEVEAAETVSSDKPGKVLSIAESKRRQRRKPKEKEVSAKTTNVTAVPMRSGG